jgi:hypothetical protein
MVRRVKAYLKNMKLITDEEKLHSMSLEIEPPAGGLQQSSHSQQSVSHISTKADSNTLPHLFETVITRSHYPLKIARVDAT